MQTNSQNGQKKLSTAKKTSTAMDGAKKKFSYPNRWSASDHPNEAAKHAEWVIKKKNHNKTRKSNLNIPVAMTTFSRLSALILCENRTARFGIDTQQASDQQQQKKAAATVVEPGSMLSRWSLRRWWLCRLKLSFPNVLPVYYCVLWHNRVQRQWAKAAWLLALMAKASDVNYIELVLYGTTYSFLYRGTTVCSQKACLVFNSTSSVLLC